VLTLLDDSTGQEYLCAAFLGPLERDGADVGTVHEFLDRPIKVTRFTVVSRA
jgi:hypothetical protein